jgi:hypothetical protein
LSTPLPSKQDIAIRLAQSLHTKADVLMAASTMKAGSDLDPRDEPVRQMLARCSEIGRACATLGETKNPTTLALLARAELESLITLLWTVISTGNAKELKRAGIAELTRAARANLESGRLKVTNRTTGVNETSRLLQDDRFKKLPKRKSVETKAQEAGVLDLYNVFYRFMSLETHGHQLGTETSADAWEMTAMHLQGLGALILAIGHVGTLWLLQRKRVENETLRQLLGLAQ